MWCWADLVHSHSKELQVAAKFIFLLWEKPHLIIKALNSLLKMSQQITSVINQLHGRSTWSSAYNDETTLPSEAGNVGFRECCAASPQGFLKRPESSSVLEDTVSIYSAQAAAILELEIQGLSSRRWGKREKEDERSQVLNATVENWTSQLWNCLAGRLWGIWENKAQYCLNYFSWDLSEAVIWSRKRAYGCNGQSGGATETVALICWVPLVCSLKIKCY